MGGQQDFFPFNIAYFMYFYILTGIQWTNYSNLSIHWKAKPKVYLAIEGLHQLYLKMTFLTLFYLWNPKDLSKAMRHPRTVLLVWSTKGAYYRPGYLQISDKEKRQCERGDEQVLIP